MQYALSIGFFLLVAFATLDARECPASHPYVYYNGKYCCANDREKEYKPQGWKCNGSRIGRRSLCCEGDAYVRCPGGNNCGNNLTGFAAECPDSHPFAYFNGAYCCAVDKEKNYGPQGAKCDGSTIQRNSLCCLGDAYVKCPDGKDCDDGNYYECPESYPNAYYNGKYCCANDKEKVYGPQGAKCDGSEIGRDSLCCEGDKYVKCGPGNCFGFGARE